MPRSYVDTERTNTCSTGFHVTSMEYAKNMAASGGHIMICKVNPSNVVSVPVDYNNQKMRVCEYGVVGELINTDVNVLENSKEFVVDLSDDEFSDTVDTKPVTFVHNGSTKMTKKLADQMRDDFFGAIVTPTIKSLADQYGISPRQVSRILRNEAWV